jgi:hypothetical protein
VFEGKDHESVRFPQYHYDLNAIQLIWNVAQTASEIQKLMTQARESISEEDLKQRVNKMKLISGHEEN